MAAVAGATAALFDGPMPDVAGSAALLDDLLAARCPLSAVVDSLLAAVVHGPVQAFLPVFI